MKRVIVYAAKTALWPSYKETANRYYNRATSLIESGEADYDIDDIEYSARKILKLVGGSVKPSCYGFAACVAAILDEEGIPYSCEVGFAYPRERDYPDDLVARMPSNHVWIRSGNKIFDMFPGASDLVYAEPTDKITFERLS